MTTCFPKYWNCKGTHQEAYERIWKDHVPEEGECESIPAEAVRCISRLYHDAYNNGGGNYDTKSYEVAFTSEHLPRQVLAQWGRIVRKMDEGDGFFETEDEELARDLDEVVDAIVSTAYAKLYKSNLEAVK